MYTLYLHVTFKMYMQVIKLMSLNLVLSRHMDDLYGVDCELQAAESRLNK